MCVQSDKRKKWTKGTQKGYDEGEIQQVQEGSRAVDNIYLYFTSIYTRKRIMLKRSLCDWAYYSLSFLRVC